MLSQSSSTSSAMVRSSTPVSTLVAAEGEEGGGESEEEEEEEAGGAEVGGAPRVARVLMVLVLPAMPCPMVTALAVLDSSAAAASCR